MEANAGWSNHFFSGLVVELQRAINSPQQTCTEAEFLWQALALEPGMLVADVPCGNGRLSLALAERGALVTGVDGCRELLDDAKSQLQDRALSANFVHCDMRQMSWREEFDAAYCVGNSFGYFDHMENREFLQTIRRILRPTGRFVLETSFAAEGLFSQLLRRRWFEFGELLCLHDTNYNPSDGLLTSTYRLSRGTEREEKRAVYRVYLCREILQLVADAGFDQIEAYGSLTKEPFVIGSSTLWLSAACQPTL